LCDHLIKIGFSTVEVVLLEDAGLMDEIRAPARRREATPEERAARLERRKAKARERSQRNRDKKKAAKAGAALPK
jgi:hypothetical protein